MLTIKLKRGEEQHTCDALQRALVRMARRVAELEGAPEDDVDERADEPASVVYAEELKRPRRGA